MKCRRRPLWDADRHGKAVLLKNGRSLMFSLVKHSQRSCFLLHSQNLTNGENYESDISSQCKNKGGRKCQRISWYSRIVETLMDWCQSSLFPFVHFVILCASLCMTVRARPIMFGDLTLLTMEGMPIHISPTLKLHLPTPVLIYITLLPFHSIEKNLDPPS